MTHYRLATKLLLALALLSAVLAYAADGPERRVALVIGNAAYGVGPLRNPVNDARDILAKLQQVGFRREDIVYRENLRLREISPMLREFRAKLDANTVALIFYSGHGMQVRGENFLPPIDAQISAEEDVPLNALRLRTLMEMLEASKVRMSLIFLDACRNNPFASSFRSASSGLGREVLPSGTLISYATRPGDVAADGVNRNGTYTEELLQHMSTPGLSVEQMLKRVVSGVRRATKGRQDPWMEGSIDGDFYFRPLAATAGVTVQSAEEVEQAFWNTIQNSNDVRDFQTYLARWPTGRFAAQAERQARLLSTPAAKPAALAPTVTRISLDLLTRQRRELTERVNVSADGSSALGTDRFFANGHPQMLAEPDQAFVLFSEDGVVLRERMDLGQSWEGHTRLQVHGFDAPNIRYRSIVSRRAGQPDHVFTVLTRFSGAYSARNSSFDINCTLELSMEFEYDTQSRRVLRTELRHERVTPSCPRGGLQVSYVAAS